MIGAGTNTAALDVTAGYILAYRLFEVAYAIDLGKAEEVWARTVRTGSSRGRLTTTPPKAISFGVPPVALGLGTTALALPDGTLQQRDRVIPVRTCVGWIELHGPL